MIHVSNGPLVPVLTAPTAAGKTALALELGARFPLEVVSADAFLVYRGMDVGTAKPTPGERARVPHHVVDVVDPWEAYDVTRFVRDAEAAISDVLARGRTPLVVGGTGFYLSALAGGLPTVPRADREVQALVEADLARDGLDTLLAEVERAAPRELARLERNPRRVVRTVEVLRRTGRVPSDFPRTPPRFSYAVTAFTRPREELDRRVTLRVEAMFAGGLLEEVRRVLADIDARGGERVSLQAIGYKEVAALVRGETHE
ncbi:tRNA (adenosine(37)-N6)-dimethylallyltransferase MiaA, partial [Deinococcus pimensis]|uniref:tRNA (adenosine(37)-N6)-dimethylallyltransferase MiaA n=1 Tax=Deinococcus pimensis TaxID=309888 RepID=UPI000693733B